MCAVDENREQTRAIRRLALFGIEDTLALHHNANGFCGRCWWRIPLPNRSRSLTTTARDDPLKMLDTHSRPLSPIPTVGQATVHQEQAVECIEVTLDRCCRGEPARVLDMLADP